MFRPPKTAALTILFTSHIAFASTMDFPIWPTGEMPRGRNWQ